MICLLPTRILTGIQDRRRARTSRARPALQELDPNALSAPQRRRASTDVPTDAPAPQRRRRARQPSAAPLIEDPPDPPPVVRPFGFLSRLQPGPQHSLGLLTGRCTACNALHFSSTDGLFEPCYKKGDAELPPIREPPSYLRALFTDDDPPSRSFRTNIRTYNYSFVFMSVSYKKDTRVNERAGIQCFQIHGQLFYYQGPLRPALNKVSLFVQLFFYDPTYVVNVRANNFPSLDRIVLLRLTDILTDYNPFITVYKTARERLAT